MQGRRQQDSHEVLRILVDGLKEECSRSETAQQKGRQKVSFFLSQPGVASSYTTHYSVGKICSYSMFGSARYGGVFYQRCLVGPVLLTCIEAMLPTLWSGRSRMRMCCFWFCKAFDACRTTLTLRLLMLTNSALRVFSSLTSVVFAYVSGYFRIRR